ncbi:MAG: sodium/solute symporter [Saprospiraceae bacterium]|nr:sodium/solute symporter [Saprospiraceae bacterium]
MNGLSLAILDYAVIIAYFIVLGAVGYLVGKKEKNVSEDYFLAGRSLPWYVVGTSQVASNMSSEQFIGVMGSAFIYGVCAAVFDWGNVGSFSLLIWLFIPFLLASRVFTIPEFLEKRFNNSMRQFFAVVSIVASVVAFLSAVLYIGGIVVTEIVDFGILNTKLPFKDSNGAFFVMEWNLLLAIVILGTVSGVWAIYGGLRSVAWTDFITLIVMLMGGIAVTWLGLKWLSGATGSVIEGWGIMMEKNQATAGKWLEAAAKHADQINGYRGSGATERLSVIQPSSHTFTPWTSLILITFSISIWYNVINQFMIQRVLGAKDMWHARMGMVLAGFIKIFIPVLLVVPGLILFAAKPELLLGDWDSVKEISDKVYVILLQSFVPAGLVGLFLAALFGAIQSTVNSVLNSTSTIYTMDIYKRMINPEVSERRLIKIGVRSSIWVLIIAIFIAYSISYFKSENIFIYIQSLYAFFAPPFAAVFLLGILFRRINSNGAITAVTLGFAFGFILNFYSNNYLMDWTNNLGMRNLGYYLNSEHLPWAKPFLNQASINWVFCVLVCVIVSLLTAPPRADQVTDDLTINWKKLNIFSGLGGKWYSNVLFWWLLFVGLIIYLFWFFR